MVMGDWLMEGKLSAGSEFIAQGRGGGGGGCGVREPMKLEHR
jgi:hypothetical protein